MMIKNKIQKKLNKEALSRVFSNILNNALKYSDGDLEIVLKEDGVIIFSNVVSFSIIVLPLLNNKLLTLPKLLT